MNGAVPVPLAPQDVSEASTLDLPGEAPDETAGSPVAYALMFAPYAVAAVLTELPLVSYCVAWAGSLFILWWTIGGHVRPLPGGLSALDQIMRPVVLTQGLFVAYNFLSSIFYVADLHGYYYFSHVGSTPVLSSEMEAAAAAQRYYVLAHAAIATGLLVSMKYRRSGEWAVRPLDNPARSVLILSGIALVLGSLMSVQNQFGVRIGQVGLVASVLGLALAFPTRRFGTVVLGAGLYGLNMGAAFLSGWKEEVLVMVLLLAVFAYPYARRTVLFGAPIALVFLLAFLPTYASIFRSLNWDGEVGAEEAAATAIDEIRSGDADLAERNWAFLTGRISEIGLFVRYIDAIDRSGDFYGTEIVRQSVESLVPRALWASKPVTEALVMQRVYDLDVVESYSNVSAKPQYVVDGYLSFGAIGVALAGLVFGLLASWASRACERWFGGYFWGTGLVYTSLFSVLWKGNTFEFFFNTVLWSFALLVPLFWLGRAAGVLVRQEILEELDETAVPHEATRRRAHWSP